MRRCQCGDVQTTNNLTGMVPLGCATSLHTMTVQFPPKVDWFTTFANMAVNIKCCSASSGKGDLVACSRGPQTRNGWHSCGRKKQCLVRVLECTALMIIVTRRLRTYTESVSQYTHHAQHTTPAAAESASHALAESTAFRAVHVKSCTCHVWGKEEGLGKLFQSQSPSNES